jgi:hypothetical protein
MSTVILQMPATAQRRARRRLNKVELDARHSWMMQNYKKWETTELDGVDYPDVMTKMLMDAMRKEWSDEFPPLTAARMRKDISYGRMMIAKRNQVKAWLVAHGADLSEIKSESDALNFMFDYIVKN